MGFVFNASFRIYRSYFTPHSNKVNCLADLSKANGKQTLRRGDATLQKTDVRSTRKAHGQAVG